ncbi:MAG: MlaE family lipid ABC transporter permease subunit [Sedimentisphaerales bacterium]|nr:MlaE family lipid ABC transporter permease subunit [Sedimentisphaerales bacterium]
MEGRNLASINYNILDKSQQKLTIAGRLDMENISSLWPEIFKLIKKNKPKVLLLDASGVDYCDGAGIGLFLKLKEKQKENKGSLQIENLKPEFNQLMELFEPGQLSKPEQIPSFFKRVPEQIGKSLTISMREVYSQISFVGEVFVKFLYTLFHLGSLRWKDTFLIAEKSGANAVGITALLGFLIGVILAFQSAISMRKFGAEIYVADLVAIVLFRELGPLLTAFVLAARTGSAFAAEIGTMKINEEVDALTTMGLEPVRFLVIPRMLAAVVITPLLTMFNNLFGILGCILVMITMGFAPITLINEIQHATNLTDLFGGLAKTFVFGYLIAGIGCLCGLQTGKGASAVGDSATRAVVSSIIAIVVADGIFAVIYYFLGI